MFALERGSSLGLPAPSVRSRSSGARGRSIQQVCATSPGSRRRPRRPPKKSLQKKAGGPAFGSGALRSRRIYRAEVVCNLAGGRVTRLSEQDRILRLSRSWPRASWPSGGYYCCEAAAGTPQAPPAGTPAGTPQHDPIAPQTAPRSHVHAAAEQPQLELQLQQLQHDPIVLRSYCEPLREATYTLQHGTIVFFLSTILNFVISISKHRIQQKI